MDNSNAFLLREVSQQLRSLRFDPNHAALAETSNFLISILPRRDENDPERFKALVSVHVYGHRRVEWSALKVRVLSTESDSVTSLSAARYVSLSTTGQAVISDIPLGRYRVAAKLDLPTIVVLEDEIKRAFGFADGGAPSARSGYIGFSLIRWTDGLIATICGEAGDTVRIWDIAGGRCLGDIPGFGVNLSSVDRVRGKPHLLVRGADGSLWIADIRERQRLCLRPLATVDECNVATNFDGSRIAISAAEGGVTVCDRDSDEKFRWGGSGATLPTALAIDGAGDHIAIGTRDGSIEVCSLPSESLLKFSHVITLSEHTAAIGSLTFFDQDRRLVSSAADGRVIVWDSASGNCLHIIECNLPASPLVATTPSGSRLALATVHGEVRMFNFNIERSFGPELEFFGGVAIYRDGASHLLGARHLELENRFANPFIIHTESGACSWQRLIDADQVDRIEFVSDDTLAVVTASGAVLVLDASNGKLQSTFMTVETDDPSINILVSTYGVEARIEAVSHRPGQAGAQVQVILNALHGGEPWDTNVLELLPAGDGFACRSHSWMIRFEPGDRFAVQAVTVP